MSTAVNGLALPGSCLQKTCSVVVVVCVLHFSVSLLYYFNTFQGLQEKIFVQNPQHKEVGTQVTEISSRTVGVPAKPRTTTLAPPVTEAAAAPPIVDLPACPENPPQLVGPLRVEFSDIITLDDVRNQNPNLQDGGRFMPKECKAVQKVALIIPFRKREEHLKYWLYYLHPILQRQQLDYGVYVIEQSGDATFNRAKLLNVGYVEALKEYDYNCFVFSDVDLIPMDDRNIYKCYKEPRHLAVSMDKFGFRLPYNQFFGGVSSLSKEQFEKINGFPNDYWGWGGEDDDIYNRITFRGMSISRPDGVIGKCRMIRHDRDAKNDANPQRFDRIARTRQTMNTDGINSLTYQVVEVHKDRLYTKVLVDVGSPNR
ncbi:beta-1,4-galactosyltransferase 1-like [Erpetoichthys calabaricus]|uniref:Beta-1,4-galactosyltransferase n=1 Tax=Erpetoichthys calabaricus TaxID=27687 RepID=A0A8C4TT35_ERPCA|nr:beta-1,4-galactosyltransferase 1-like [Erpetoichthys calabaricus]